MKFLIVIPTYNEIQNLRGIVTSILEVADAHAKLEGVAAVRILIVDDNSPDGTGELADEIAKNEARVSVLHRAQKEGLGKAYIAGFNWGLKQGYDAICEMDADFSHDPKYLPDFWKLLQKYDVVIGSRYVAGGGIRNWSNARKFISKGGSLYARTLLGLDIHDLTGGFNAWKREVLEAVDLTRVQSEGYAFQIELKYRAAQKGFKIAETPIVFDDRTHGKSKMSKKIFLEAILRVAAMRLD